jgi:hypothetical protein
LPQVRIALAEMWDENAIRALAASGAMAYSLNVALCGAVTEQAARAWRSATPAATPAP